MNEQHLKLSVVGINNRFRQRYRAGNRGGVAHSPENVVALAGEIAEVKPQMMRLYLGQILHRVEQICRVTERVFEVLRRCVRKPRECAERRNIGKVLVSELADVYALGLAGYYIVSRREHI